MFLSQTDELTEEQIDSLIFDCCYDSPKKSDYVILLGGSTESAIKRAEIAADLYKKCGCGKIIATGGVEQEIDGRREKECAIMRRVLVSNGVPQDAIIEEPRATDTVENMVCSLAEICKDKIIWDVRSVTVVTEPFHLRRSLFLAQTFLPSFITIHGYTDGADKQRVQRKNDRALKKCIDLEIGLFRYLISKGIMNDIQLV